MKKQNPESPSAPETEENTAQTEAPKKLELKRLKIRTALKAGLSSRYDA